MHSKLSYVTRRAPPRHESHQRPAVRVLNFNGGASPELFSDGVKRSIQNIQQKVGVLLVQAHRRGKADRLTVQAAFAKQ
jgi:hypothetical protein